MLAPPLLLGSAALVLAVAVFAGGGSDDDRIFPIGSLALAAAGAALVLVAAGSLPRPRVGRAAALLLLTLTAFVLWSGISIVWSVQPDGSWDAFNRGSAYVAVLLLGLFVGGLVPRAPRVAGGVLAVVLGLAVAWALVGKVVPALGPELDRSARLRAPVGYWNALALLVAMSLPLWLWVAARPSHRPALRAGATGMLVAGLVALALTTSRGGILVGAIAVAAWLALTTPRLEGIAALIVASPIAAVVAAWALSRPGLAEAGVDQDVAARDGALFGVVLAAALALVFVLALAAARQSVDAARRRRLERLAAVLVGLTVLVALLVGGLRVGDPAAWARERLDEFRNPRSEQVSQDPERLTAFSSNHRWTWWGEAGRLFLDDPAGGTGAGSFGLARRPLREDTQVPLAPHNIALQALSETGVVGFLLLLAATVAGAFAVVQALRRLSGSDRAVAAALAAGLVAYLAHSLVDMGWEYVAVSAPFFLALGVLAGVGHGPPSYGRRQPVAALVAGALVVSLLASLAFPWLAQRSVDDAYAALERGDFAEAAEAADNAAALNPLSIEPLRAGAVAEELRGNLDRAERLLLDAVELQPENPETWYELGRFEFEARGELEQALRHLDRSYALDSFGPSGPVLDEVRAAIAARAANAADS
jgi:tetratricopeptide (TPR) repeat protein